MREIVVIAVGNCGIQIGHKLWENLAEEHGITGAGSAYSDVPAQAVRYKHVYFNEGSRKTASYARAILIDTDEQSIHSAMRGRISQLYNPNLSVSGSTSSSNNFAKGFNTEGLQVFNEAIDIIRKEVERTDCFQGFQLLHSVGGGTGSGLFSRLVREMKNEYPDRIFHSFSVFPSDKVSETVVEPYNAVLSFNYLLEYVDEVSVVDNEALYKIYTDRLKLSHPSMGDLNHLIALTMSGVTASLRFPGQLNSDLRKISVNMVPFPRLHFLSSGFAPLVSRTDRRSQQVVSVKSVVQDIFSPSSSMVGADPSKGKYFSIATIFRGKSVTPLKVEDEISKHQNNKSGTFFDWIPNGLLVSVCNNPMIGCPLSCAFLANSTSIQKPLNRVLNQHRKLSRQKAFIHWYEAEGMSQNDFREAEAAMNDLISEYQMYETDEDHSNHYKNQTLRDLGSEVS